MMMMLNLINPNSAHTYVLLVILIPILSIVFITLFFFTKFTVVHKLQGNIIIFNIYYQKLRQNHKKDIIIKLYKIIMKIFLCWPSYSWVP